MDVDFEHESALEEALMALSETTAHAVRQHLALNLLANRAIECFFDATTSNGSHHRFGIGVVVGLPLNHLDLDDLGGFSAGGNRKQTVIVVWETLWKQRGVRQLSVFNKEGFRQAADQLRTSPEHDHTAEPFAIAAREVGLLMGKAMPLLVGAEDRYRAARIPRATS